MEKRIRITADSTCDLSPELVEKYSVTIIPLYINMGGGSFRDGVDIVPADIFEYVDRTGELPKTSAVTVADYSEHFSRLTADGGEVIHLNISADFSGSYQSACIAAESIPGVHVVDARNLSTGIALLVIKAAELSDSGLPAAQIADTLRGLTGKVDASFLIDRLHYLAKGGRCSSVAALGANLLKLRPCIEVKDGKMGVGKKYRGKYAKCIEEYVEDRLKNRDDLDASRIFITHTPCDEGVVETAMEAVRRYGHFEEILETTAGCTISTHCGPNTLGILYMTK